MSGVLRAYSLADVLGTLNSQSSGGASSATGTVTGVGFFSEADESVPMGDTVTAAAAVPAGWDGGVWGATVWS